MGRLTLNMLLSFAQFEREVTGERIRDKIAASKRKGMWMGGLPPLGYDVRDKKLVVNEVEAETVRTIYWLYTQFSSVRALKEKLDREGIVSKSRTDRHGRQIGGKPLARGALYLMLQNRIYRGEIMHKDKSYPGQHAPIINEPLWSKVQETLSSNRVERQSGATASHPSLLAGLIYDHTGERMTPTHANKKGRRYRYYVSQSLIKPERPRESDRGRRVPANDLERLVIESVTSFLRSRATLFDAAAPHIDDLNERRVLVTQAVALAERWHDMERSEKRRTLLCLVKRIDLGQREIAIVVRVAGLRGIVGPDLSRTRPEKSEQNEVTSRLVVPAELKRVGMETKLLICDADGRAHRTADHSMLRLLGQAHHFRQIMLNSQGRSITELAREAGVGRSYFGRIVRLGFLAPDIVKDILSDRCPPGLTAKQLSLCTKLPTIWEEQVSLLDLS
jgi:hypothetical protein